MGSTGRPMQGLRWAAAVCGALAACCGGVPPADLVAVQEGEAELAVGDPARALRHFEHALLLDPDNGRARRGLALAELALGRPRRARAQFEALARRDPGLFAPDTWRSACRALREAIVLEVVAAEPPDLLSRAESSPLLAPCRAEAVQGEALLDLLVRARRAEAERLRALGDVEGALAQLARVLEARPGDPAATLASLPLLLGTERREQALRLLSEALSQHPGNSRLIEAGVELLVTR